MSFITFYNRNGEATAYTEDEVHIYMFDGKAVAYFYNESVYSYSGRHLGRYEKGWIRDNSGYCIFFNEFATNGPIKPIKGIKPIRGIKSIKPIKSVKEIRPTKPVNSLSWSNLTAEKFFI